MADVMNNIKTRLVLTFDTPIGRQVSLSVDNPKEDVSEPEIKTVMDTIVEKDIFAPYGSKLSRAVEAKVVLTDTTEYDLDIPVQ